MRTGQKFSVYSNKIKPHKYSWGYIANPNLLISRKWSNCPRRTSSDSPMEQKSIGFSGDKIIPSGSKSDECICNDDVAIKWWDGEWGEECVWFDGDDEKDDDRRRWPSEYAAAEEARFMLSRLADTTTSWSRSNSSNECCGACEAGFCTKRNGKNNKYVFEPETDTYDCSFGFCERIAQRHTRSVCCTPNWNGRLVAWRRMDCNFF